MAKPDRALPERFTVGDWIADRHSLSISRAGSTHPLEPRAFGVLCYLAQRPQKLVTVDELLDALWADTVVTPNAVTRIIAQLRKSLGDEARHPRYIQTVSRMGYRLVAPVAPAGRPASRRRRISYAGAAAMAIAGIALAMWFTREPLPEADASVAVLPFENFTGDISLDYLGDGVAEEVINSLAQVPDLKVSARSLSFRYSGNEMEPRAFARELGVTYLVEGSVRTSGDKLRITAQLVAADSGFHLWSHTSEQDLVDLFAAQDAISAGVVGALAETHGLVSRPAPRAGGTPDPEAYDLYLRGRYVWHHRDIEPLEPAVDAFTEAVKIDPDFARGWAALASAYLTYPHYSPKGRATWHLAEDAAKKAMRLDPGIPEVYGILGTFAENRLQWIEAARLFEEGVRRGEQSATAHFWYSEHLAKTGRYRASLKHLERAIALDPLYKVPQIDAGFAYMMFGDFERGAAQFERLWDSGSQTAVTWMGNFIGRILTGEFDEARRLVEGSAFPAAHKNVLLRYIDIEAGESDATTLVRELFADPDLQPDHRLLTWFASRLGAFDPTLDLLLARLANGHFVDGRPLWGPGTKLSEHPRFVELAEALGLIEYWDAVGWTDFCRRDGATITCNANALSVQELQASVD